MKTPSLFLPNLRLRIKLFFLRMVSHVLTENSKRSIFLTFIFMKMKNVTCFDRITFTRMNDYCNLVKSVNALEMPALLFEHIFSKELTICSSSNCDFKTYAKEVLSKVPFWLMYNEERMRGDLLNIVKYCNNKDICVTR